VPLICIDVPTGADVVERLVIDGPVPGTVNATPLLWFPPTFTTTFPVVAAAGTGTFICVALQLDGIPDAPLKLTVLALWDDPKFFPAIVTDVPADPEVGEMLVMAGAAVPTSNPYGLLGTPPTVTTTLPVVAPDGTGTTMVVALQLVGVAVVPLKMTVLVPCDDPKLEPVMVADVPIVPPPGDILLMLGSDEVTVKSTPLLSPPPTETTTSPVEAPAGTVTVIEVSLELVGLAYSCGLKTTWGVCVPPAVKAVPEMVNDAPTGAEFWERPVIIGDAVTVNASALLDAALTLTTTFPEVAPEGTWTSSVLLLHETQVTGVPLNVTVLVPWVVPKPLPTITTVVPTGPLCGVMRVILGVACARNEKRRMKGSRNSNVFGHRPAGLSISDRIKEDLFWGSVPPAENGVTLPAHVRCLIQIPPSSAKQNRDFVWLTSCAMTAHHACLLKLQGERVEKNFRFLGLLHPVDTEIR